MKYHIGDPDPWWVQHKNVAELNRVMGSQRCPLDKCMLKLYGLFLLNNGEIMYYSEITPHEREQINKCYYLPIQYSQYLILLSSSTDFQVDITVTIA
jgi:hypothetical protein